MVRKFTENVPDETVWEDLERYRQRAIETGATDAKIISTDAIIIDERVRAKCMYPRCPGYGTNIYCPPYAMDLPTVRKVVSGYRYAVFLKLDVPPEDLAGPEARKKQSAAPYQITIYKTVAAIEKEAFYDGYHLALGFASGPCKLAFCPADECRVLATGKSCRHFPQARSSMEAVGMDCYTMATRVGWDVYPIGMNIPPADVRSGINVGLVLIY